MFDLWVDGVNMRALKNFQSDESGGVAILGAFVLPLVVGFFGIGIEVGLWQSQRSELQASVDATATASAIELEATKDKDKARLAAYTSAIVNEIDVSTLNVSFNKQGKYETVAVDATRSMPRYFSLLYSDEDIQMVSAGAAAYSAPQRIGACVLALAADGNGIELAGTANIVAPGCSLHSNAIRSDSFDPWGSSHVEAECITTVQTSDAQAHHYTLNTCPEIEDYVEPITDPYASVPIPAPGDGASAITGPYGDFTGLTYKTSQNGDYLGSGIYEHLLINSNTVIEKGATIVVDSGTLEFKGNTSASGEDVTFILIDSKLKTGSQFNLQLSAKTTGTYAGMLFVGDRHEPKNYNTLVGGATTELTGAVYFPYDSLDMVGGSQVTAGCFHVIAAEISLGGNASFGNVCGGKGTKVLGEDSPGGVKFVKASGVTE